MIQTDIILEQVAKSFFVETSDITGPRRDRNISEARFFYIKLAREINRMTYNKIASDLNRKACSAISGENRANQLIEIYPDMKKLYNKLKHEITME